MNNKNENTQDGERFVRVDYEERFPVYKIIDTENPDVKAGTTWYKMDGEKYRPGIDGAPLPWFGMDGKKGGGRPKHAQGQPWSIQRKLKYELLRIADKKLDPETTKLDVIFQKLFKKLLSSKATIKNYLDFFRYTSPFIKEIEIAEWLGNQTDDGQEVARKALKVLLDIEENGAPQDPDQVVE